MAWPGRAAGAKKRSLAASAAVKRSTNSGADLVVRLADHRAERGADAARCAPSFSIAAIVASSTPVSAPFQPACAAPITPALRVGEQDRAAVGGGDADREARHARDDRVGARRILARPWLLGDDHVGRMDLVAGDEMRRRDAERGRHAGAVLAHACRARRSSRCPPLRLCVDAVRHAAFAGEEGVADVREVRRGTAAWIMLGSECGVRGLQCQIPAARRASDRRSPAP